MLDEEHIDKVQMKMLEYESKLLICKEPKSKEMLKDNIEYLKIKEIRLKIMSKKDYKIELLHWSINKRTEDNLLL